MIKTVPEFIEEEKAPENMQRSLGAKTAKSVQRTPPDSSFDYRQRP